MAIIIVLLGFMLFPSEEMIEFRKHSGPNPSFAFVEAVDCEGGMRQSGYSYAPGGRVMFKQVSEDGSVEMPVCDGELMK